MARVVMYEPGFVQLEGQADKGAVWPLTDAVADDSRRYCPVLTGKLKSTIREDHGDGYGRVWCGNVAEGVDYHIYQEYGTRYMSAQPYMRPALYQERSL